VAVAVAVELVAVAVVVRDGRWNLRWI
jgi:hypothetical protein